MKLTVSPRTLKRDPRYQRLAHNGAEVLVTNRGKPYVRVLPPPGSGTFVGVARAGKPLKAAVLKPAIVRGDWSAVW